MIGDWFIALIAALELMAAGAYGSAGQWTQAVFWTCYACGNVAYLLMVRP